MPRTSGGTGGGVWTISEITSDDSSVTITDPTGPTTDLSVSGGGGGLPAGAFPLCAGSFSTGGSVPTGGGFQTNGYLTAASVPAGAFDVAVTSLPSLFGATSVVVALAGLDGPSVTGVDTTTDDLILTAILTVANQLGTEAISVMATGDIAMSGPGQDGSVDWSTATPTAVAGADLTWNPATGVSTTAGGIFTATLTFSVTWD